MKGKFEKLFKVPIEHKYFADLCFNKCKIWPSSKSALLFKKYALVYEQVNSGFIVYYNTIFEGKYRNRESVLKEVFTLQFHFNITDPLFYAYTNIPNSHANNCIWLSNFEESIQIVKTSDLLHISEYVSESDLKPSPADNLNNFGYIEIKVADELKEDLHIRFLNNNIYWRYIITSLQKFDNLSIVDEANQIQFSEPEIVELADGTRRYILNAVEAILCEEKSNMQLRLVANYNKITNHFEEVLISKLPNATLNFIVADGKIISEIYVVY
jgi:hypothetical protein